MLASSLFAACYLIAVLGGLGGNERAIALLSRYNDIDVLVAFGIIGICSRLNKIISIAGKGR